MEPLPIDAPAIIDELRRRALLPQRVLAARAGVSQQTLSAYERGHRAPTLTMLQQIAAAGGFQLRVSVEPLGTDVASAVEALERTSSEQWLANLGMLWEGACILVEGIPHRYEGLIAARAQGVPLSSRLLEVAVPRTEATLSNLVRNARRCFATLRVPGVEWATTPGSVEAIEEQVDDDVLHWHPYGFPEVRMRLAEQLEVPLLVKIGDTEIPVTPLADLWLADPRARRIMQGTLELRRARS